MDKIKATTKCDTGQNWKQISLSRLLGVCTEFTQIRYLNSSPFKRSVSRRKQFRIIAGLRKNPSLCALLTSSTPTCVEHIVFVCGSADMTHILRTDILEGNHKNDDKVRKLKANRRACIKTKHQHADWISFPNYNTEMYKDGEREMEEEKQKQKEEEDKDDGEGNIITL